MTEYVNTLQHHTNCSCCCMLYSGFLLSPQGLCGCHVQPTMVDSCNMLRPVHGRAAVDRLRHVTSFQIPKHHLREVGLWIFRSKRLLQRGRNVEQEFPDINTSFLLSFYTKSSSFECGAGGGELSTCRASGGTT